MNKVANETELRKTSDRRDQADQFAMPMFMLSVFFLVLLAGIVVTWVDIPRVAELAKIEALDLEGQNADSQNTTSGVDTEDPESINAAAINAAAIDDAIGLASTADKIGRSLFITLLCIWPLFWLEYAYNYTTRKRQDGSRAILVQPLLACLIPPLRLGAVSAAWNDRLWLPSLSWQHPGHELSEMLERIFGKPMLLIALLILPILLIEFVFKGAVQEHFWLRLLLHLATGFIWFAFAFEFIIMVSASDKKFSYIKKNWIDLAIILIPLISFLRTLRVLRLAKLAKIQKIAKLGRVYRVRSLGMKAMRALMMFEVINRILKTSPEKRLAKLNAEREERTLELDELNTEINDLESSMTAANTSESKSS